MTLNNAVLRNPVCLIPAQRGFKLPLAFRIMKNDSPHEIGFKSLAKALRQLEYGLDKDGIANLIVAQAKHTAYSPGQLPPHVRLTPQKRHGKRIALRGRRHFHEKHIKLAHWPEDEMDENPAPFLMCVIGGQADFRIGDYILRCHTGDMVLVPAGVPKENGSHPHFEGKVSGRVCDVLWITPDNATQGLLCWICRSEGAIHRKEPGLGWCRVTHLFLSQLFAGFCHETQKPCPAEVSTHLLQAIARLLRGEIEAKRAFSDWDGGRGDNSTPIHDPIQQAQELILEDLTRNLTIKSVAQQVSVSPATLTRRFKEQTGLTFHEYRTHLRMQRAEEMLAGSNFPVAFISARVGLKYGQLRALFQKTHGVSPGEFRERKLTQS